MIFRQAPAFDIFACALFAAHEFSVVFHHDAHNMMVAIFSPAGIAGAIARCAPGRSA